ncbi:weak acid resistance protein 1 [Kluyveromyces marxianus]|nr:weak acid resistance protein 1 [Kluyveromyces marxianus]
MAEVRQQSLPQTQQQPCASSPASDSTASTCGGGGGSGSGTSFAQMSLVDQQRHHPQVFLLGISADDPRHFKPMSKERKADGKTKRNTFACITCHSMKQKCNPGNPNDIYRHPCVRCAKLNKLCQFDLSKRRRKKKKKKRLENDGDDVSGIRADPGASNMKLASDGAPVIARTTTDVGTKDIAEKDADHHSPGSVLSPQQHNGPGAASAAAAAAAVSLVGSISAPLPFHGAQQNYHHQTATAGSDSMAGGFVHGYPHTRHNAYANMDAHKTPGMDHSLKMKQVFGAHSSTLNGQLSAPAGWQFASPVINQRQRLLPKPWLEADLKRLEHNSANNGNNNTTNNHNHNHNHNNSHVQAHNQFQHNIDVPHNSIHHRDSNSNAPITLGQHFSTTNHALGADQYHNSQIQNRYNNTLSPVSTGNGINVHPDINNLPKDQTLKFISPTIPSIHDYMGENGENKSLAQDLRNASPVDLKSPALPLKSSQINDYELEITNLLSWQKGALELISEKLSSQAAAWDDIVQTSSSVPLYTDPLALGLISEQDALYHLKLYRETMSKKFHLPLVKIPDDVTIDQLRKNQPILFSTILSVVSLIIPASHKSKCDRLKLDNFALSLICHHGMRLGSKRPELIRSLLVLCLWYNFSEWNNQTRYHFFNYICCSAIREFDLNGNSRLMGMMDSSQQVPVSDKREPEHDDDFYRMVLVIYVSGLNISIFLRQPIQLRWSPKFDSFCEGLLKGQYPSKVYGFDSDQIFVVFSRINYCLELIHTHIQLTSGLMENTYITFDTEKFIDKMKITLDGLAPQIAPDRHRMWTFFHSVYVYLYESILIEFFQSRTMEDKFEMTEIPKDVEDAFIKCTERCLITFQHFFELTPHLIASMPLFHVTRIIYVLGVLLLKVRFGVMTISAIHHLKPMTDSCGDIVRKMCELLEETSALYPHNTFVVKLRYMCALFSQTYATNLRKYLERQNRNSDIERNNLFQSGDVSSFFVDSMILENSINSLNEQFWTDMLTNLL